MGDARRRGTAQHREQVAKLRAIILKSRAPVFLRTDGKDTADVFRHNLRVISGWALNRVGAMGATYSRGPSFCGSLAHWGREQDPGQVEAMTLWLDISGYAVVARQEQRATLSGKAAMVMALASQMAAARHPSGMQLTPRHEPSSDYLTLSRMPGVYRRRRLP